MIDLERVYKELTKLGLVVAMSPRPGHIVHIHASKDCKPDSVAFGLYVDTSDIEKSDVTSRTVDEIKKAFGGYL